MESFRSFSSTAEKWIRPMSLSLRYDVKDTLFIVLKRPDGLPLSVEFSLLLPDQKQQTSILFTEFQIFKFHSVELTFCH